jgi:hypothetical protein
MNQRQQFCFFGVLFLGAMSLSGVALAQFAPDPFFYRKPEQIRPDLYGPNGSDPAPRFRSSPSSSSQFSSKQVREFANRFNNQLSASPRKQITLKYICSGNGDSVFQSRGFSPTDIAIFKNELGC